MSKNQLRYLAAFILIVALLGGAEYLQIYLGVTPCPLCIMQRFVMMILGFFFLIGIIFAYKVAVKRSIGFFGALFSFGGILLAGRQVWLQHLPPNSGENCEVSLQYLMSVLPLKQVAQKVFEGSSGCSQVGWEFMHITLAQWSLLAFIFFFLFSLFQMRRN